MERSLAEPVRMFMPGAFAHLPDRIRAGFAEVAPGVALWFHEFVPSGLLAREIGAGAAADVYVSANTRYMDELFRAGLIADPRPLAGNRLCIIVRPDAAARIHRLADLTVPDVSVVVPQPETDPCGQYVRAMFGEAGVADAMEAKRGAGTLLHSRGSGDLPGFLLDGRALAGIFYASEAVALGDHIVVRHLPDGLDFHDRIAFTLGRVRRAGAHPAAPAMHAWLLGPAGQHVLVGHGFLPAATVSVSLPWAAADGST